MSKTRKWGNEMANRNITVSLTEEIAAKAKIIAERRGTSVAELLCGMLEDLVAEEREYREAEARFLRRMREGFDLGTEGDVRWTRDETHERRVRGTSDAEHRSPKTSIPARK